MAEGGDWGRGGGGKVSGREGIREMPVSIPGIHPKYGIGELNLQLKTGGKMV
jgi:hypothetical protein